MDWLVFGDDWGAHPSTTQHLIRHLPATDNILWVNSIGMRAPGLSYSDAVRLTKKAKALLLSWLKPAGAARNPPLDNMLVVDAPWLPWHQNNWARRWNQSAFNRAVEKAVKRKGIHKRELVVLAANPVAWFYLNGFSNTRLAYLRLDDYSQLPGVDSKLAALSEEQMIKNASVVFATARNLMVQDSRVRSIYLPQGVDWKHFAQVPSRVPNGKVVGFHGLLAEWIDYELICSVATALPDWRFEFVGPVRYLPDRLTGTENLHFLPAVAYHELPKMLTHWAAAWIPFRVDKLTKSVNPLKLREYLAAGLPTLCTPLPEASLLLDSIDIISNSEQAVECLLRIHATDNNTRREKRKKSVHNQDWSRRSSVLRETMQKP